MNLCVVGLDGETICHCAMQASDSVEDMKSIIRNSGALHGKTICKLLTDAGVVMPSTAQVGSLGIKDDCRITAVVGPPLEQFAQKAHAALAKLSKRDFQEFKALAVLPPDVLQVLVAAQQLLAGIDPNIATTRHGRPSDTSLPGIVRMMGVGGIYVQNLQSFKECVDEDGVPPDNIEAARAIIDDGFSEECLAEAPTVVVHVYTWLINMMAYYDAFETPAWNRWRYETDDAWVPFSARLNRLICWSPRLISYEIDGDLFEADRAARTQWNLQNGTAQPIRPPNGVSRWSMLEGSWQTRDMFEHPCKVTVGGALSSNYVKVDDEVAEERLEKLPDGRFTWKHETCEWSTTEGSGPLGIIWSPCNDRAKQLHGGALARWTPTAAERPRT